MIGRFKRIVQGPEEDWPIDTPLDANLEVDEESMKERAIPKYESYTPNSSDYYLNFVRSAITNDGKFSNNEISVWWLRTILAGLEGRDDSVEALWETELPDYHEKYLGAGGAGIYTPEMLAR